MLVAGCASKSAETGESPTGRPTQVSGEATVTTEPTDPFEPTGPAELVDVVDGDTLDVRVGGVVERVRLIGVNAPERGECFYAEATERLVDLLDDGSLRLESDTSDRDQYGRLLRYVWAGETLVNERLVLDGLAIARRYEPDTTMAERFETAQDRATDRGAGLWGAKACGAVPRTALSIVTIESDAPGDDGQNLNGEWAVIANDGSDPVDLTGWILKDESSSHRFSFPDGFRLGASSRVTVFSGCGTDTTAELFWCQSGSAVWNNQGDTGFLLDPSGNIVTALGY